MAEGSKEINGGPGGLAGARILVAEDEAIIAMELEAELTALGAIVVGPMLTVSEALASAREADISAAVLDLRLGRQSIDPVARVLTERGVPFLFYSGQLPSDPERSKWPDVLTVTKPATGRALVAALAPLLG